MRIGLLHSLIRKEEKLLIEAFKNAGVEPVMIDDRKLVLDFNSAPEVDVLVSEFIEGEFVEFLWKTDEVAMEAVAASCSSQRR